MQAPLSKHNLILARLIRIGQYIIHSVATEMGVRLIAEPAAMRATLENGK